MKKWVKKDQIILTEYCPWLSCHLNIWCTSAMNRNANQGKLHHRSLIQAASNFFLAVQNSSIGDLVTHSVTFWFWHYRVILETCNLWGIWSNFSENLKPFPKSQIFPKISTFSENFNFFENFKIFRKSFWWTSQLPSWGAILRWAILSTSIIRIAHPN